MIDGDMLVHRSTVAVEKDTRFDDRFHILHSDADAAWNVLEDTLYELSEIAGTEEYLITFSDKDRNFRKGLVGDDYKSNRKGTRKPLCYYETRLRCEETYPTAEYPQLEADDVMGILMTSEGGSKYILWTLDKDLRQIEGRHVKEDEVIEITEAQGDLFFYQQIIAGDVTDGYHGATGFGMEAARKLLEAGKKLEPYEHELTRGARKGQIETRYREVDAEAPWETVMSCFEKAGMTYDDALYNAQMARILRAEDYPNGKIKLWTPTTSHLC